MKYSKIAGVVRYSGGTTLLKLGTSIDDEHPLAKEKPHLFTSEDPGANILAPQVNPIERATAAPGDVRTTPGSGPRAGVTRVPKGGSTQ